MSFARAFMVAVAVVGCGGNVVVDAVGTGGAPAATAGVGGHVASSVSTSHASVASASGTSVTVSSSSIASSSAASVTVSSSSVVSTSIASSSSSGGCGGLSSCNGKCVDLESDPDNCGTCGVPCPPNAACVGGNCVGTSCCTDNQNDSGGVPNCSTASWLAWEYVPSCDIAIARLELFGTSGGVALYADAGGRPGTLLFHGSLTATSGGWGEADVSPSVVVTQGQLYWLASHTTDCSVAASGIQQQYYASSNLHGPWDGPYQSWHFTAHVLAACFPP